MRVMSQETVLVTGASSGIGRELARLFAAERSDLVLVARRREQLEQLAGELTQKHGVQVRVLVHDLADPAAPTAIAEDLAAAGVSVDVLVNNAGFGAVGTVAEIPLQRQLDMLQVNVLALTHLTRLLLPGMLQRRRGGVLNVGSMAGFQPGPHMAVYYATKAYVLSFSEALYGEVASRGLHVTCLAPGATATEFAEAAQASEMALFKFGQMDAVTVARAGYRGFRAGRPLVIPGFGNRLVIGAARLLPRSWVRRIASRLNRKA